MVKHTTESFIEKSIMAHGDRYDYSLSLYTGCKDKIKIICSEHGVFEQTASHHYRGKGCPSCNGGTNITQEEFIKRAIEKHGDEYDYSLVEYIKSDIKVKIICRGHGIFEQKPAMHILGNKCPKCYKNYKLTKEIFIERANKIHNNYYDYSLVEYINAYTKIKIICPKHGMFEQLPVNHLNNECGCALCAMPKGEVRIKQLLDEYQIKYEIQKRFKDCRHKIPLPFDFYLPDYNILIEYDGMGHFEPMRNNIKKF